MTKGQTWLARALVPMAFGVSALCFLAFRPCEPVAQAASGPRVLQMPVQVIIGDGEFIPEVNVEDLPKVRQGSRKMVAGVVKAHDVQCWKGTPGARLSVEDGLTPGSPVLFADCRK